MDTVESRETEVSRREPERTERGQQQFGRGGLNRVLASLDDTGSSP